MYDTQILAVSIVIEFFLRNLVVRIYINYYLVLYRTIDIFTAMRPMGI